MVDGIAGFRAGGLEVIIRSSEGHHPAMDKQHHKSRSSLLVLAVGEVKVCRRSAFRLQLLPRIQKKRLKVQSTSAEMQSSSALLLLHLWLKV